MRSRILAFLFFFSAMSAFGQLNMADSTVQVITYWNVDEQKNYAITEENIKISEMDTISASNVRYHVEVSVIAATDDSYTVQWRYHNVQSTSMNPMVQKLWQMIDGMKIMYKIDAFGEFVEVINSKEIFDYTQMIMQPIQEEVVSAPVIDHFVRELLKTYGSEEIIAQGAMQEIQQYHTYHGGKYKLNQIVEWQRKSPNTYGVTPFNTKILASLDEVDEIENNFVVRSLQDIDQKQLINALPNYRASQPDSVALPIPQSEDDLHMENKIRIASLLHGSGWIIYSTQKSTFSVGTTTYIKERVMEVQ